MFTGFAKFILTRNVVDLAVGVVFGAAFGAVITALVKDILTPLIAAIGGTPNFAAWSVEIHHSKILYGDFINALLSFLLIAAAIYYLIAIPMNALIAHSKLLEPDKKKCPECLSDIPLGAKRCAFCGAAQPDASGSALQSP